MIKAIFWDNDGILVDTERLYFEATRTILAGVDVQITPEDFARFFLKGSGGAWHLAAEKGLTGADIERLRSQRNELYSGLLRNRNLAIPGALDTIKKLHEDFIMGVVTSCRKDHFALIHQSTGLLDYFDFVITRESYAESKPDPEPYLLAVEKSGCPKKECLVIEDSERGLLAAKAAGLTCWIIPTAFSRLGDLSAADRILSNISEVADFL